MSRKFQLVSRGSGDLKARYRPQHLNEAAPTFPIRRVSKIVSDPNASQIYLFEGATGTGKTSVARIVSRASVCVSDDKKVEKPCLTCAACRDLEHAMDFMEINVANFRKIDDVRTIIEGMRYAPTSLSRKIYIFDEGHQLTHDSQQLLLKVFEEPPAGMLIFLCTTEKKGLKQTLIDRAATVTFKRLTKEFALGIIDQVLENEKHEEMPAATKLDMVRRADGSARALMNFLQAYLDGDYDVGVEEEGEAPSVVKDLAQALMAKDWAATRMLLGEPTVRQAPESIRIGVSSYLRAIALGHKTINNALSVASPLGHLAGTLSSEPQVDQYNQFVLRCMRACYKK